MLSVIVLARDRAAGTRRCLAALLRHTPGPLEVLLVDNASGPRAAAEFRRLARRPVRLIRNARNVPFAAAVNAASRAARGDLLCWLNNDAVVGPGWRLGLEAALRGDPRAAAAGPRTDAMAPPAQLEARPGPPRPTPFLGGFCLLLRRSAFERVGPLDERFVWGWEDMDYCLRLRAAGFRLLLAPSVVVRHAGSGTIRRLPAEYRRRTDRANRELFCRRWAGPGPLRPDVFRLLARTPAPWDEWSPEVSVVVPVRRAAEALSSLAALAGASRGQRVEVLLAGPERVALPLAGRAALPARWVEVPAGAPAARAVNAALASDPCREVVVLAPGSRLSRGAVERLRAAARPGLVAVAPRSERTVLRWQDARTVPASASRRRVPFARGGCLYARRQVFERAGPFDERLLWPWAEADFCLRLGRAGGSTRLEPSAVVRAARMGRADERGSERASVRLMFEKWGGLA